MARMSYNIELYEENTGNVQELEERVKNMSVLFQDIINEWAKSNEDKFMAAQGRAQMGAEIDPGVFWEPLSPDYLKQKIKRGEPNAIMFATGALEMSLSNPESIFQSVGEEEATFGRPLDPEDAAKAAYNWAKRQTIFLSADDSKMIEGKVHNYFTFGDEYKEIMFAKGMAAVKRRENATFEIDFPDQGTAAA